MRHCRSSYMLLALLTVMLAVSGATASAQTRPATPVAVVNTTLPVSGTVTVSAITAPVVVDTTTPLSVTGQVAVTDTGQNIYAARVASTVEGGHVGHYLPLPAIPSGHRLVLEYVGLSCTSDPDDEFTVDVYVANGGAWHAPIPVVSRAKDVLISPSSTITAVLQTRLYSDQTSSAPQLYYSHSKASATVRCEGAVSGYTFAIQ